MINEIIKQHKKWLGTHETPKNSNNVIFNTHYYGHEVSGSRFPWCCVYQWDIFRMAGLSKLFYGGKKTASCTTLLNYYERLGLTGKKPKVGALAIFQFPTSRHIGFVVEVIDDKRFKTYEGNTTAGENGDQANGDQVAYRTRNISQVVKFIYPKYTKKVHTTREVTIWSAPEKADANREKTVPEGYEITVYEPEITVNGEKWYKTIKDKYVLAKYCL